MHAGLWLLMLLLLRLPATLHFTCYRAAIAATAPSLLRLAELNHRQHLSLENNVRNY